ncbi:MAG: hypothetical protein U0183_31630 [Polyangiaceae bacterium]
MGSARFLRPGERLDVRGPSSSAFARHAGEWLDLALLRERATAKRLDVAFAPKVHALSLGRAAPLSIASGCLFDHAPSGSGMVAWGDHNPDAGG